MICVVLRSFPGPGDTKLQAGEEVDVSEWRHADKLIAQRYLRVKSLNKRKIEDTKVVAARESLKDLAPVHSKKRRVV